MKTKNVNIFKRFGLKENRVEMGLFDFTVIIIVGDYENVEKYIGWKFDDNSFCAYESNFGYLPRGKCFFKTGYVPVVWIPKKPRTAREHATFAHECLHAVFHLFEWSGLSITRDTEEVMTHAMAHLIANGLENA